MPKVLPKEIAMPLENWIPCESPQEVDLIEERMRAMEVADNEPAPRFLKIFPLMRDFNEHIDPLRGKPRTSGRGQERGRQSRPCL
jgi:hypothetical protein